MTKLVVTATGLSVGGMRGQAIAAFAAGADLVELRLDLLEELPAREELGELLGGLPGPCIVTCRPVNQGGQFDATERERLSLLTEAVQAASCTLDFEFDAWQRSDDVRRKVLLAAGQLGPPAHPPGRLILSHHDYRGKPAELERIAAAMAATPQADVVKIAWRASDIGDNFVALDLIRSLDKPAVVLCMGDDGLLSRVLAGKVGAALSYCSLAAGAVAAPGQLTLAEMKRLYGWDSMDEETAVFGVVGHPIAHTLSPVVHNAAFAAAGINAVYLPMHVAPGFEPFERFVRALTERRWLHAAGLSVTTPHKLDALTLAGSDLDDGARRCGAVNTLHFTDGGVRGYNTDCDAAVRAITEAVGGNERELRGLPAAVLGAGGVARAVVAGLVAAGCEVTIYNRTAQRAARLAADFACRAESWEARTNATAKLLINCTRVGMWPRTDDSPMPADAIRPDMIVLDTVYNPRRTRLLADAEAAGARTASGVAMFIEQAARQFEIWTGRPAPREVMRQALEDAL